MYYKDLLIKRFFILDWDNQDNPQDMLKHPELYEAPDAPEQNMSASQMRDMMNVVANVSGRIGGYEGRVCWFVELFLLDGQVVEVLDYNDLKD